ncbi:MAG TPA: thioesterase family protein [Segeticoccus sp.]|uniref:thioesterase family protein n=1 Tax=Segeticoccus sp. TaxID=2706531 RepID=UPI002D7E5E99|nr:thioesterase family protein [Segeticoccus sp.]HET8599906.1 thioesterase family protein [Segeticoccus sp.]
MTVPVPTHREPVRAEWIDYNGHLSEPYYVLVFGHATDGLMDHVGLGPAYRERTGCSLYTVEAHVRYLDEVARGARLEVDARVLGVDEKRVHYCLEMTVDGTVVSTEELLGLHVDSTAGRAVSFPEATVEMLRGLTQPAPPYAGRAVGLHPR